MVFFPSFNKYSNFQTKIFQVKLKDTSNDTRHNDRYKWTNWYITIKTLTIAISDITLDSCVYRDKKPTIITLNMFLITKSISIHKLGAEKLICTRYFHILLEFNCCGVGIEVFIRVSINYSNPMEIEIFPHQDVHCWVLTRLLVSKISTSKF